MSEQMIRILKTVSTLMFFVFWLPFIVLSQSYYPNHVIQERLAQNLRNLKSSQWYVRSDAARALGEIKAPRAVKPLITALKDENPDVRRNAIWALGEIKDPRAVKPLGATLMEWEWDRHVRRNAVVALGKIKDPRGVKSIAAALKDKDTDVRRIAARTLGEFRDLRAVEPLIGSLKDVSYDVTKNAEESLKKITGKNFGRNSAEWQSWWEQSKIGRELKGRSKKWWEFWK